MTSKVQIINDGLDRVGATEIVSPTEGTVSAKLANRIYDTHRLKLLRRHTWNFATKRIKLAQSATKPVYEYEFQYPVPSDFLRIVSVSNNENGSGHQRYKLETDAVAGKSILTFSTELFLRYIADIQDPQQYDSSFSYALSLSMATVFAIKLANSNTLYRDVLDELKSETRSSRSIDSQEDFPDGFPDGSWSDSRHQGDQQFITGISET